MSQANVRLATNVICVRRGNGEGVNIDGVPANIGSAIPRLGYFEALEYKRANPQLFYLSQSPRQIAEMNGPRGRAQTGLTRLWRFRPDLKPVAGITDPNPFLAPPQQPAVAEAKARPQREIRVVLEPLEEKVRIRAVDPPREKAAVKPDARPSIEEQDRVTKAGVDHDMLVVAPPGTGKTHVVIQRIAYLVGSKHAANPLEEILVLSFSRSAVAEVRKRLAELVAAGGDERMLYARVQTFDAFASHLLRQDLATGSLVTGYSQRIEQLNAALLAGALPNAAKDLAKVRFLIVDEVQDLNGARAEMVLELARIVKSTGGCCLFLGDPAQAIYDFGETDGVNDLTSVRFLETLISGQYCGSSPEKIEFSNYRRFDTEQILSFVRSARDAMGADGLSPDSAALDELLRSLGSRLVIEELKEFSLREGRKAVLTRNNLEAYWLWNYCRRADIPVTLWRGSEGNDWPGWIGRLTKGFANDLMSLSMAEKRWDKLIAQRVPISFETAVHFLEDHQIVDTQTRQIKLLDLHALISRSAPISKNNAASDQIVISTIHRSKGLEFEHVLLYAPKDGDLSKDGSEVRVVYVAATRARKTLQVLARDQIRVKWGQKNNRRLGLWTKSFHLPQYPQYPSIGLLVDGAHRVRPGSIALLKQPLEAQDVLWDNCSGIPRNLLIRNGKLIYEQMELGELVSEVQEDITKVLSFRGIPSREYGGIVTDGLATVALDPDDPVSKTFGAACLGVVPVITGVIAI